MQPQMQMQIAPEVQQPLPLPARPPRRSYLARAWFGWWAALCLVVLAYNTHQQLATQQRILAASQVLEEKVAEAGRVSAATNLQLGKVAELDRATAALSSKLKQIAAVNSDLRTELVSLESTVEAMHQSVIRLDEQAVASHDLMKLIVQRSDELNATLKRSQQTSTAVAGRLGRLVDLQEQVNADLQEMTAKTAWIDQMMGR